MKFGIQIEPQFGFSFDEVTAIARDAEELGADGVWISDHLFLNDGSASPRRSRAAQTLGRSSPFWLANPIASG